MINETKLDETVPLNFYSHLSYRSLRRDRGNGSSGGGIMVFIKKSIELVFSFNSLDFEFIYFELKINNKLYAFISAYKSPKIKHDEYLDALYDFLLTRDLSLPLFIIGDLNMDLLTETKSQKL